MSSVNLNVMHLICSFTMGGAEKLLVDLLKVYKQEEKNNINYSVVIFNNLYDKQMIDLLKEQFSKAIFLNRREGDKNPKNFFALLKIIKENNIDIIHTHDYGSKMWAILAKIFVPGLRVVFTLHDTKLGTSSDKCLKLVIHRRFVDMNISISESVHKVAEKLKLHKTKLIYNGTDIEKYFNEKRSMKLFFERNDNIIRIVNVSRVVHDKKGQDVLIEAVKLLKDMGRGVKCDFIGDISNAYKESFEYLNGLVKKYGLEDNISFLGQRTNIEKLLKNYDLFVLPSRYEGFGLVITEAMAAGLPVVASNIEGPSEIIENGKNGYLFECNNSSELADKIIDLIDNTNKFLSFSKAALERVQDFNIVETHKQYCSLYHQLKG